jgi:drug/metabolite transporter (DMT)-like permease
MFRGSIIIFSAILSNLFLDKKLEAFHWVGIVVVTVGLLIVGAAALLPNGDGDDDSGGDDDENANLLFGIIITVVGQACGAAQMVVEEKLLKGRGLMPSQVVGYEGMWGVLFMSFILLPVFYLVPGDDNSPHYENALDALHFIFTDSSLLWMAFVYTISISFYNFCGLSVAQHLSTVHRTLIDALRTTLVWGVDLFIYYVISENFGEVWDNNSWIQLGGFVLLFIGTIIYNKVVTLPCLQKQPAADLDYMAAEF